MRVRISATAPPTDICSETVSRGWRGHEGEQLNHCSPTGGCSEPVPSVIRRFVRHTAFRQPCQRLGDVRVKTLAIAAAQAAVQRALGGGMTCLATSTRQEGWSSLKRGTAGHVWKIWDGLKGCNTDFVEEGSHRTCRMLALACHGRRSATQSGWHKAQACMLAQICPSSDNHDEPTQASCDALIAWGDPAG